MSIASKLEKLATDITSAYSAVNTKGGTIPSNKNTENLANAITSIPQGSSPTLQTKSVTIRQNGSTSVTPDTGYDGLSSVAITTDVSGGGGSVEEKDVNFYDYDGTLTNSYTKAEFLALTELPENPTHAGLTAQGWNWSLSDAKTYVTSYGILDIGQMYITDDGKTRIYVTLDDVNYLSPYVGFAISGTATIEWGDGTSDTVTGTSTSRVIYTQHTYSNIGNYVIKLSSTTDIAFSGENTSYSNLLTKKETYNTIYQGTIKKIELGSKIMLNFNAFYYCYSMQTITIPNDTKMNQNNPFQYCLKLKNIVIPNNNNVKLTQSIVTRCQSLEHIEIPNSITNSTSSGKFQGCSSLKRLTLPNSITSLAQSDISGCTILEKIIIPNTVTNIAGYCFQDSMLSEITIPNSVTTIDTSSMFSGSRALKKITLPNSCTEIKSYFASNCASLIYVEIPSGVTAIGTSAFGSCGSLQTLTLPNTITSIGNNAFQYCYGLTTLTLPSNLTSIGSNAFSYCNAVTSFDFSNCAAVPTLSNTNAFNQTTGTIIVPDSLYET